jgi:hypothetical protein
VITVFFQNLDPQDVITNGAVVLAFTDNSGRRQLRAVKFIQHVLAEQGDTFEVTLSVSGVSARRSREP